MGDVLDFLEREVQNHSEGKPLAAAGGVELSPKGRNKSRGGSTRKKASRSQSCFARRKDVDELGVSSHHSTVSSSSTKSSSSGSNSRSSRRGGRGGGGGGRRRHTTGNFIVDELDLRESNHSTVPSASSRSRARRSLSVVQRRTSDVSTPPVSPTFSSPPTSARSLKSIGMKYDVFGLDPMDVDIWED